MLSKVLSSLIVTIKEWAKSNAHFPDIAFSVVHLVDHLVNIVLHKHIEVRDGSVSTSNSVIPLTVIEFFVSNKLFGLVLNDSLYKLEVIFLGNGIDILRSTEVAIDTPHEDAPEHIFLHEWVQLLVERLLKLSIHQSGVCQYINGLHARILHLGCQDVLFKLQQLKYTC